MVNSVSKADFKMTKFQYEECYKIRLHIDKKENYNNCNNDIWQK